MILIRRIFLAALMLAATVSCAPGVKGDNDEVAEPRVCFNSRSVRNFDPLTNKHLYVREGRTGHYLITLRFRCRDLNEAFSIAISDTTGRVCSGGFGKITFQDRFNDRIMESCAIKTIERVDDKEHARRIVNARIGAPTENTGTWSDIPEPEKSEESKDSKDADTTEDPNEPVNQGTEPAANPTKT